MRSGYPRNEGGQALTEFVVVFPLFLLVIIFCIWLWEIGHVRLKLTEAARYTAWEATAYRLHDYNEKTREYEWSGLLDSQFNRMRLSVMSGAFIRYVNLDSSQMGMQTGRTVATWAPPKIWIPNDCGEIVGTIATLAGAGKLCGNEAEELIYGGPLVNLIARFAAVGFTVARAMSFSHPNLIAQALIAAGGATDFTGLTTPGGTPTDKAITSGGAGTALTGQLPYWNFNAYGYVHAYAQTTVKNEWFNVRIFGEPLFEREGITFTEHHSVMADSWRLNQVIGDYMNASEEKTRQELEKKNQEQAQQQQAEQNLLSKAWGAMKGTFSWFGEQKAKVFGVSGYWGQYSLWTYGDTGRGPYWNELSRLYFATPTAKITALSFIMLFKQIADMALFKLPAMTALATGLTDDDFLYPSLAVRRYGYDKEGEQRLGWAEVQEQGGTGKYHTLPFQQQNEETLKMRGDHYDGCKDEESMGCVPSLSSDSAWGSQIVRP